MTVYSILLAKRYKYVSLSGCVCLTREMGKAFNEQYERVATERHKTGELSGRRPAQTEILTWFSLYRIF